MRRLTIALCFTTSLCGPVAAGERFDESIARFLGEHCNDCHGADKQKSGVRFDTLAGYRVEDAVLWTKVHRMLRSGEMPPEKRPQPLADEMLPILRWIEESQAASRSGQTRRLNRREYSAALQDLTGIGVDFAGGLPEDGKVEGFDTGAEGLKDAADSVEQMLEVARRAVEGIRFIGPAAGSRAEIDFRDERFRDIRKGFGSLSDSGIVSKGSGTMWVAGEGLYLKPVWLGERDRLSMFIEPPEDRRGIVRLRLRAKAAKGGGFRTVPDPHLAVEIGGKQLGIRPIDEGEGPVELEFYAQYEDLAVEERGLEISLRNLVELPYSVEGFENDDKTKPEDKVPGRGGLFRPKYDRKARAPGGMPVAFVVLSGMEIDFDFVARWPPGGPVAPGDDADSARRLLALWAERAFRRPLAAGELEPYLDLYRRLRAQGLGFDEGLRAAFQSVLMSGPSRYLEPAAASDFALASRLGMMLTGRPPDGELRVLAASGRLRERAVLDAQVDRLLGDGFVRPFVEQWLELGQPITLAMDHIKKADFRFGRYLKESMRAETVAYVAEMFAGNRPARELVLSNWTMMNDSLAHYYGYPGIRGAAMRRVPLRGDDPRGGGILGHAGIQSMLCWMGDNWVIYRGAWTLRHILDDPPPPAPLEVPELDPTAGENRGRSMRELLEQHQADQNCAVCHRDMDPVGFAYQNFDLSGRWREVEFERYVRNELDGKVEWRGEGVTRGLDTSGRLPGGEEFSSFAQFKEQLAAHYLDDLLRGLMKKLVIYGTGRQPDVSDLAEIDAILIRLAPSGYPMRHLIKELLSSKLFLAP